VRLAREICHPEVMDSWFHRREFAYRFLKKYYPAGQGVPMPADDIWQEKEASKLKMFFRPRSYDALREKIVIDFGCGAGWTCVEWP